MKTVAKERLSPIASKLKVHFWIGLGKKKENFNRLSLEKKSRLYTSDPIWIVFRCICMVY